MASKGIIPLEQWYHYTTVTDKYGYTVALYLAKNGIVPPNYWQHDKYIRVREYNQEEGKHYYYTV